MRAKATNDFHEGFTLIELSIVLVIIGLIVGGVLVGQSLISAAAVRAQISQIEKFNTAANTFRGKYGYLPGDIKDPDASSFGFPVRGPHAGQGDGNGVIEGYCCGNYDAGIYETSGETVVFWVDLSTAHLIGESFSTASSTTDPTSAVTANSTPSLNAYLPSAKIGNGNVVYIWSTSGGDSSGAGGINYYGVSAVTLLAGSYTTPTSSAAITVAQAYAIDKKIDDGLPQLGNVLAVYTSAGYVLWAGGTSNANVAIPASYTTATPGSSNSCFDNDSVTGATQQYSVEISNGSNLNCALSFRMQAGD